MEASSLPIFKNLEPQKNQIFVLSLVVTKLGAWSKTGGGLCPPPGPGLKPPLHTGPCISGLLVRTLNLRSKAHEFNSRSRCNQMVITSLRPGKTFRYVTNHQRQLSLVSFWVDKSSTDLSGWGYGSARLPVSGGSYHCAILCSRRRSAQLWDGLPRRAIDKLFKRL